ncbi:MAG TPA: APC family permease [Dehalococcoidia bacterium]
MANEGRGRSFLRRPRQPLKNGEKIRRPSVPAEAGTKSAARGTNTREERARIVVPRQERGRTPSQLDVELREVRWGAASKGAYLRVVPSRQRFTRSAPGRLTATLAGSRPPGAFEHLLQAIKGAVLGSPFANAQALHERLTKIKALAVFSSDALSSSAYATEEILLVLVLAGSGAFKNVIPIALVIAVLLALVTISYRQTIRAYPSGGGAYIVAHENLGQVPGLIAAAALLVDYALTVAVSVAAGVAAVTSAAPGLLDFRVLIGVVVILLIMVANLRGVREAGSIFAIPTYVFILMMSAAIVIGVFKVIAGDAPGSLLHQAPPQETVAATQGLGLFLILKAFSSGCTALTGVEAISNGVPAFQPPESRNARTTLTAMAFILGFLFLGVTFVTSRYGFVANEHETIVSQLGKAVFGKNAVYYVYQAATALILCLAANTSYADFPRLSAILANDRFMPRQFSFRGDRLAFSNGILLLSVAAIALIVGFNGQVANLIPLYAVGVFVSFTLSQGGMVIHWLRLKETGWRVSLVINFVGMVGTAIVALIIASTKFLDGAWLSIIVMLILMCIFILIHRHYRWYEAGIAVDESDLKARSRLPELADAAARPGHAIIPVDAISMISLGAIEIAQAIAGEITVVHLTDDSEQAEKFQARWNSVLPDVPLLVIESPYRAFAAPMLAYIESLERTEADRRITVILPGFKAHHWWESLLHNQAIRRLKPFLAQYPNIRVVDFMYDVPRNSSTRPPSPHPASA